jgi:hypothetical protein
MQPNSRATHRAGDIVSLGGGASSVSPDSAAAGVGTISISSSLEKRLHSGGQARQHVEK